MTNHPLRFDRDQTVTLNENLLIGEGDRRYCYEFPDHPEFCIKVPKSTKNSRRQQQREIRYYKKLAGRGVPLERITRYHGSIDSNLGTGYVYDAVRDQSGEVSRKMIDYLKQNKLSHEVHFQQLDILENYLFRHQVIVYDINPWNIVYKQSGDGEIEPFLIDGVGDVVAIPILNLSDTLVKQKIKRRWLRMINYLQRHFDWMASYQMQH